MAVRRGEVWLADLSPTRGTEQSGVRPVLVVQTDRANPHSPHTIFVPFTTRIRSALTEPRRCPNSRGRLDARLGCVMRTDPCDRPESPRSAAGRPLRAADAGDR